VAYSIPLTELIKDVPDEQLKSTKVPPWLKHILHIFGASDLRSYWGDDHLIYEGKLRLLIPQRRISLPLGKWRFIFDVLDEGLPFTLWVERKGEADAKTLKVAEPADRPYKLLVQLATLTIQFDPAVVSPGRLRTEPQLTIEPVEGGDPPRLTLPQVSLLLDSKDGLILTACQSWEDLTEQADSFILQTQLKPRYVTILNALGLGLDRVIVDLNTTRTPPAVQRIPGHGPSWQGVYLDELLICAPVRMPRISFATRAQDFVIGLDGKVSGRFTAEFAKNYAITDGRLKFKDVKLYDQEGKELERLDTPAGIQEYLLTAAQGPCAKARVKTTVTGAKKGEKLLYEVRVDGKRATEGQSGAAKDNGEVDLETALFEVAEGTHELGLFVAQKPPAASGVRYATQLSVTFTVGKFQDATIRVTVTRPEQRGFQAASERYVEGVVPLHIVAEHPVRLPVGHRINRTWTLMEDQSGGSPQVTERLATTVDLAGDYVVKLDYTVEKENSAGHWLEVETGTKQISVKLLESRGDSALDNIYLSSSAGDAYQGRTVTVSNFPDKADLTVRLKTYEVASSDLEDLRAQKQTMTMLGVLNGRSPDADIAPTVDYLPGTPPEIRFPSDAKHLSVLEVEIKRTEADDQTAFLLDVAACFGLDKTRSITAEGKRQVRAIAEHAAQNEHVSSITFWVHALKVIKRGETLKDALGAVLTSKEAMMGFKHVPQTPYPSYTKDNRTIKVQWLNRSASTGQQIPAEPDKNTIVAVLEGRASTEAVTRQVVALPLLPTKESRPELPVLPPKPPLFESSWFRRLRVELGLLRSEVTKGQVEVVADLFDAKPPQGPQLPQIDDAEGLVRFVAGITRDPMSERLRIESSYRADPRDKNGLFPFKSKNDGRDKALSWLRLYFFALPPAAAISEDAAACLIATAVAAGLAATLRALPSASAPNDKDKHALQVTDVRMQAFHLRVETGEKDQDMVVIAADYDCDVALDFSLAGFKLQTEEDKPIQVQYRNVGFLFGGEKGFDFFYEPSKGFAIDVKDTGVLKLPEWASSLLSLNQLRVGVGSSLTVDVTLGLKQNLGLIKLSSLPLHVVIDPDAQAPKKKLNVDVGAIRAGLEIPNVLTGSGMILVKEKQFLGSLYLELVRPKFTIEADLALSFQDDYTAIYAALYAEWGVGVPLANSGAALYGLAGLFGMHYGRKREPKDAYQWYVQAPEYNARAVGKWEARKDNLAFGAGVVIGTLTDGGRAFNLKGMLILELPGPRFLLAVRANLLSTRPKVGSKKEGTIVAVVDLDFEAKRFLIKLAVRYAIEKVLKLQVPAEAFFELPDGAQAGSYHIWIGHDKKKELQVRLTVFDFLEAWGYLMIQSDAVKNLAGTRVTLPGPCIAFGLHAELGLGESGDPIYLLAYLDLHVGLGLAPIFFYGMARVGGELHLVVVGVGVWAELQAQASKAHGFSMEGKVCGYVELFLWKLEGCFAFKLGPEPTFSAPESALDSLTFRHRATGLPLSVRPTKDQEEREAIVGKPWHTGWAETDWKALDPVPIDCVPILQFRTGVNYGTVGGCFDMKGNPPAKDYWEEISDRLKYKHSLNGLRLFEVKNGQRNEITGLSYPATWPSDQAERRTTLQLNEWKPALDWMVQEHTAKQLPGYVRAICETVPPPETLFYTFDRQPTGPGQVWHLRPTRRSDAPMVTVRCEQRGALSAALMQAGYSVYGRARIIATPSPLPAHVPSVGRVLSLPLDGSRVEIETRGLGDVQLYFTGSRSHWPGDVTVDGVPLWRTWKDNVLHAEIPQAGRVVIDLSAEGMGETVTDTLRTIYLVAVRGVATAERAESERRNRQRKEAQRTWQHRLQHGAGEGAVLKPGTRYVLEVNLAWNRRAYKGETRELIEGKGTDVVKLAFRTADTVPVGLADYVKETLPAERAESHYYTEPLSVCFKTASIHQHIKQYENRRFVIFARSERGVAQGDLSSPELHRPTLIDDDFEEALLAALHTSSCLSAQGPVQAITPTVNLKYETQLLPNSGYTAYLTSLPEAPELANLSPVQLAERSMEKGTEHYKWSFTTSRYATFSEHVLAHEGLADWILRDPPAANYERAVRKALGQVAAKPKERRGDALLEQVLYDVLHCEAMPPAMEPMSYRLWVQEEGAQGPAWRCLGLLFDSPEPLFREEVTGLEIGVGSGSQQSKRPFALAVNARGTRALIWSPGLDGDPIDLSFSLTKPAVRFGDKKRIETTKLRTYVRSKPGAYLEEN
jgi:hypothetical protein